MENQTVASDLTLNMRNFVLGEDEGGHAVWQERMTQQEVPASQVAIIICDMWDAHWSRGATERVNAMAPRMNDVLNAARAKGVHIIHAPSDTLDFYIGAPARRRAQSAPAAEPPNPVDRVVPPLPIDDSDEGSDTGEETARRVWTRQHVAIEIDQERDALTDDGHEVYNLLQMWGIRRMLIMGVHTNMCVLNRSFAIKQMVRWGVPVALVRDLTDTMYNPARSPYVSHHQGTALVIGYIERFWCPTITSDDILKES